MWTGTREWLDSTLSKVLASYGIRTPPAGPTNRGEAAVVAKSLGFPVVMKVRSPDAVHKTDVGGVKLGLRTEEEAARAFDEIRTSLARTKPSARFDGVTLERMVSGGIETIVGMTRDPLFGPVLLFGLGGVAVELLRDVSVRVAPLTDRDADEMIRSIRSYPLLEGYRGAPPSNTASLLDLLHRVSHMATDHPQILEMDLNPVLVFPGTATCIALDVRIKVGRVEAAAPEPEAELAGAAAGPAEVPSAPSSPRRR
jgi:acetyltransferase